MARHGGSRVRALVAITTTASLVALGVVAAPAPAQSDPYARIAGQPIDRFDGHREIGEREFQLVGRLDGSMLSNAYDNTVPADDPETDDVDESAAQGLLRARTDLTADTAGMPAPALATASLVPQTMPGGKLRSDGKEGVITAGIGLSCDGMDGSDDHPGVADELCLEYARPGATAPTRTRLAFSTTSATLDGHVALATGDFLGAGYPQLAVAWTTVQALTGVRVMTLAFFRIQAGSSGLEWVEFGQRRSDGAPTASPAVAGFAAFPGFAIVAGDTLKNGHDQLVTYWQGGGGSPTPTAVFTQYDATETQTTLLRNKVFPTIPRLAGDGSEIQVPVPQTRVRLSMVSPRVNPTPKRLGAAPRQAFDQVLLGLSASGPTGQQPVAHDILSLSFTPGTDGIQLRSTGAFIGHAFSSTVFSSDGTLAEAGDLEGDGIGDLVGSTARGCTIAHEVFSGRVVLEPARAGVPAFYRWAVAANPSRAYFGGSGLCATSNVVAADDRSLADQVEANSFLPNVDDPSNAAPAIHTAVLQEDRAVALLSTSLEKYVDTDGDSATRLQPRLASTLRELPLPVEGDPDHLPDPIPAEDGFSSELPPNLAAAAHDGLLRVGEPKVTSVKADEPLVVLNASPTQFDLFDGNVFDPHFCYGDNLFAVPEVCFFKSTYQRTTEASREVTSEINDEWAVSSKVSAGGGFGDIVDVEATLKGNVGEKFSKTRGSTETAEVDVSVTAKNTDQAYVLSKQYDVLEYPLWGAQDNPATTADDDAMVTIRPVVTRRRWIDVNSQSSNFRTAHQPGNLLSYVKPEDVPNVPFIAAGRTPFGEEEFQVTPTSDVTYSLTQEKVTRSGESSTFKWGIGVGASVEVDFLVKASLEVEYEYNREEIQTATTSVGDKTRIEARFAQLDGTLGQMNYLLRPFAYYTSSGALVLDYAVDPEVSPDGIDTFWDRYYGKKPDATMVLPNYQERERYGETALTTDALQFRTKDMRFRQRVGGVCQPESSVVVSPLPGQAVCVDLTVRNLSLKALPGGGVVHFHAGDPDVGGVTLIAQADLDGIGPRESRQVTVPWTVPAAYAGQQVRVFARVDGRRAIAEIKEDNNKGFAVLRVQKPSAPAALPYVPRNVFAERVGDTTVRVVFDAPEAGLPVPAGSWFTVEAYEGESFVPAATAAVRPTTVVPGGAYEATISGIPHAGSYRFAVRTNTGAGTPGPISDPSEPIALEPGTPSAPSGLAVAGTETQSLSWQAPESNGSVGGEPQELTGYEVRFRPTAGGDAVVVPVDAAATSAPIRDLVCGTAYEATVTALNAQGAGPASDPVTFTFTGPPPAPGGVTATVDLASAAATVTWTPSAATCGAVTGYEVRAEPAGTSVEVAGTATTATFPSLPLGTTQTFTVRPRSSNGTGAASVASLPVLIARRADAPAGSATAGNGKVTVSWTPPAQGGGTPVTGYVVRLAAPGSPAVALVEGTPATARSHTFSGVDDGREHTWSVAAVTGVGEGQPASGTVTPLGPPSAPQRVSARGDDGEATVSWDAPSSTGGSAITKYVVQGTPAGTVEAPATARSARVVGLTNGERYTFTVRAVTAVATGPASNPSNEVLVAGAPGAPSAVTADSRDRALLVRWNAANARGGTISGYRVAVRAADGEVRVATTTGADRQALVGELRNGVGYLIEVVAFGPLGEGPAGTGGPVTPATVPGQPREITAVDGDASVRVGWLAPTGDGGAPVTAYRIRMLPSDKVVEVGGEHREAVVTGLTNGQATRAVVTAINRQGAGSDSAESPQVTPAAVPDKPTEVVATPANRQITVAWKAPAYDGGAVVTGYRVTVLPSGRTVDVAADQRSVVVGDLVNGQLVAATVAAINRRGIGPASDPSAPVTPGTVPSQPTNVQARKSLTRVDVSWSPPAQNGGSPITGYVVRATAGGKQQTVTTGADGRTATFNATQYLGTTYVSVQAINAFGVGPKVEVVR